MLWSLLGSAEVASCLGISPAVHLFGVLDLGKRLMFSDRRDSRRMDSCGTNGALTRCGGRLGGELVVGSRLLSRVHETLSFTGYPITVRPGFHRSVPRYILKWRVHREILSQRRTNERTAF
jgi:hypothetical protein